mmetsp:Transcript_86643/g.218167  ORF Transcript_86643/g.218167 Transcript_86643/m.218167 type:complete len:201 (+) Transcript_86643:970-1572(+)
MQRPHRNVSDLQGGLHLGVQVLQLLSGGSLRQSLSPVRAVGRVKACLLPASAAAVDRLMPRIDVLQETSSRRSAMFRWGRAPVQIAIVGQPSGISHDADGGAIFQHHHQLCHHARLLVHSHNRNTIASSWCDQMLGYIQRAVWQVPIPAITFPHWSLSAPWAHVDQAFIDVQLVACEQHCVHLSCNEKGRADHFGTKVNI